MKKVRCAIYTRKSSEEGLEQDFNSLDAQREACSAYIASQASEGWSLINARYDDGGLSGGTLERPALLQLLDDVRAGRIDIIVVYKVDRLTRSLLDSAKLVEAFDETGTSFVSVTQSFNTTNSMGRLTLNMLLSFAQFEREVTAERIRDKIAASKAKGMWMGGIPPLGYEPDGRSLKVVEDHATIVKRVFELYLKLGNVRLVADTLIEEGVRSPSRTTRTGKVYGGGHLSRGQIYTILKNPVYVGQIAHKDEVFQGQHDAIIEQDCWDQTQAMLKSNSPGKRLATRRNTSPLAGLLFLPDGDPLVPVHSTKGKTRYRYYVSRSHQHGEAIDTKASRLPAPELERFVLRELQEVLTEPTEIVGRLGPCALTQWLKRGSGDHEAKGLTSNDIAVLVTRIDVHSDHLAIWMDEQALASWLGIELRDEQTHPIEFNIPCTLKRSGHTLRFVDRSGVLATQPQASPQLIAALAKALAWWKELSRGEIDIAKLSRREGVTASYMTRIVRLAFLSPHVTEAFLCGSARADLTTAGLFASDGVPGSWSMQEMRYLGGT